MEKINIRKMTLGKSTKADIYPATLSTETPVFRDDFFEILEHNTGSVDFSRFPLPVLESHDSSKVNIGVAQNPRVENGKLRADIRFGNSARALELKADIDAGIVTGLSVGYRWIDFKEERRENHDYVIVRKFMPFEISIVAIPADENAGFFRGYEMKQDEQTKTPATAMQIRQMAESYGFEDPNREAIELIDKPKKIS